MNRLTAFRASILLPACIGLALLADARPAHAQTAGTTGTSTGGTLVAADFFVSIQDETQTNLSIFEQGRFFNRAACDCDRKVFIYVTMLPSGFAKRSSISTTQGNVKVMIGSGDCTNTTVQATGQCQTLPGSQVQLGAFLANPKLTIPTTAKVLSKNYSPSLVIATGAGGAGGATGAGGAGDALNDPDVCVRTAATDTFTQTIYLLIDTNGDGVTDVIPAPTDDVRIDLTPPPPPLIADVSPGNEAVIVKWTPIDYAVNMDLAGYQILCRRANLTVPVFKVGTFTPYVKSCDAVRENTGPEGLDPAFVCSPMLSRSTSSFRVKILQNDIVYGATVVAIDNSGNASVPEVIEAIPEKTLSFYDYYRSGEIQGQAQGGFCAVASAQHGDKRPYAGGAVAAGAAVAALILRARRRRRS